ncbi:MAG: site-specific DNA-methyltransferase [Lachnospiraceae bacterium]|jgi:DNA modification methylase|nr:site-specific DNA-methyltransferase [Lachnospiraceae bacterium]
MMEKRKLTKEDIDKVRHIEGFPLAEDKDIIALSDPPYYTACPNPFIADFIREHGTPYDEATDNYHREPFAADVSEGKNDPIYNAHSYHTKVPHKAIMRYILHYTEPGDVVFDGFCGTGMTGVAAQMCGNPDSVFKMQLESEMPDIKWGARKAILSDLSPAATFIAYNYNTPVDVAEFQQEAERILAEGEKECGWMYETQHIVDGAVQLGLDGKPLMGRINYTVWSEVLICPNCGRENVYWDMAADLKAETISSDCFCANCNCRMLKRECQRSFETRFDNLLNTSVSLVKFVPVLINYTCGGRRYEKTPDEYDFDIIEKTNTMQSPYWIPNNKIRAGDKTDDPERLGIFYVHQMYTKRNAVTLGCVKSALHSPKMQWVLTSAMPRLAKQNKFTMDRKMGIFSGTLIIPSLHIESSPLNTLKRKVKDALKAEYDSQAKRLIQCGSLNNAPNIPDNCCDYIFTDPPFGDNINYSELNYLWESWLKVITNTNSESIVSAKQGKKLNDYKDLMERAFREYYRVVKPNRWMTVEFHNSRNAVWNAISESIQKAGFVIADVRILDKRQSSYNQVRGATQAIKQDLVISAYKPKDSFKREFEAKAGKVDTAWAFVRQHLENLPVVVVKNDKVEIVAERQAFLLFDRMVAYHIMRGTPVPIDAADFYKGLSERFLQRDSMYFHNGQVNEYDTARIENDVAVIQFELFVTNEKTAIAWLYQQLGLKPQTYQDLQPQFMQEVKTIDKHEAMPELSVLLEENFLQDERGKWYVPDVTKASDVAKLREKKLIKEFEGYLNSSGKLRNFRSEAIRMGFAKLWAEKNFKLITETAARLPESVIAEDDKLLMYVDLSAERV